MGLHEEKVIDELRKQWKNLWQERLDDKIRAESIATSDYSLLFLEKGTIICATKDYKSVNLREIIDQHQISNPDRFIPPDPKIGGLTKFIKRNFPNKSSHKQNQRNYAHIKPNKKQCHRKKGGRGWLNK